MMRKIQHRSRIDGIEQNMENRIGHAFAKWEERGLAPVRERFLVKELS